MNVVIVHGSNPKDKEKIKKGYPLQNKRNWLPWIKEQLEKKGIKTFTPLMPKTWDPTYEDWKEYFEQFLISEETILIGHSAGASFLVRFLGEIKKKIKKLILVAPFKIIGDEFPKLKNLCDFKINRNILENIKEIIIFISNNDFPTILESTKLYHETLGGKLIELKGRGHFIEKHMGTNEFPELLEEVLK